jgi:predicted nucleic acid-binding protein
LSGWVWTSQSTSSLLKRAFSFYATLAPPHPAGGSGLIETGADLATTEPIVMELLAGADTPERLEALDTLANGLPLLSVDVRIDFRQAAGIYQAARRRGHTVRSLVDCLIASVAMRHDVSVLHEDRDYAAIAACLPLREHRPR